MYMLLCLGGRDVHVFTVHGRKKCILRVGRRNVQDFTYHVWEEGIHYVVTVSGWKKCACSYHVWEEGMYLLLCLVSCHCHQLCADESRFISLWAKSALFWDNTQRVVVIPCRRFGTTYKFHLDPLTVGVVGCPETSVRNYHYTLRNIPQKRISHQLLGGSLESNKFIGVQLVKKIAEFYGTWRFIDVSTAKDH